MQTQQQITRVAGMEELVFDHAAGRAHEGAGVRVVAPLVARDVDHAAQATVGRAHRGGRAGQESVAFQIVFGAVHDHRAPLDQGRADGIGASQLFFPQGARAQ